MSPKIWKTPLLRYCLSDDTEACENFIFLGVVVVAVIAIFRECLCLQRYILTLIDKKNSNDDLELSILTYDL